MTLWTVALLVCIRIEPWPASSHEFAGISDCWIVQIWGKGDAAGPTLPVQASSSMACRCSHRAGDALIAARCLCISKAGNPWPPIQTVARRTHLFLQPGLRSNALHSSSSPFSELDPEQDQLASRDNFAIPIPAAPASASHSRDPSDNPPMLRGHISLRDWAGLQPSSSLQSLHSLGDSLPSLGDWATVDAAARFRDLSRDSPDFGFGSNGSSPSGSSPQTFGLHMPFRSKSRTSLQQNAADADFSFPSKQAGQSSLHGIAEEHPVSKGSPDSDGEMLLRSLQNVSAMSDDQAGASSLLMLHDQATTHADPDPSPPQPWHQKDKRIRP